MSYSQGGGAPSQTGELAKLIVKLRERRTVIALTIIAVGIVLVLVLKRRC